MDTLILSQMFILVCGNLLRTGSCKVCKRIACCTVGEEAFYGWNGCGRHNWFALCVFFKFVKWENFAPMVLRLIES